MLELTDLEIVALSEMVKQHPELAQQIAAATVTERRNSGVGFFTDLAVDRSAAAAIDSKGPLGNVWLNVQGDDNTMTFLLFLEDGYIDCLEGATMGFETVGIDLSSLRSVEVLPSPKTTVADLPPSMFDAVGCWLNQLLERSLSFFRGKRE